MSVSVSSGRLKSVAPAQAAIALSLVEEEGSKVSGSGVAGRPSALHRGGGRGGGLWGWVSPCVNKMRQQKVNVGFFNATVCSPARRLVPVCRTHEGHDAQRDPRRVQEDGGVRDAPAPEKPVRREAREALGACCRRPPLAAWWGKGQLQPRRGSGATDLSCVAPRASQVLTPEEFVAAGDYLVRACPTWSWCAASQWGGWRAWTEAAPPKGPTPPRWAHCHPPAGRAATPRSAGRTCPLTSSTW
jgi:hypothetical protein